MSRRHDVAVDGGLQPPRPPEAPVDVEAEAADHGQADRVAEVPRELGHVTDVGVDSCRRPADRLAPLPFLEAPVEVIEAEEQQSQQQTGREEASRSSCGCIAVSSGETDEGEGGRNCRAAQQRGTVGDALVWIQDVEQRQGAAAEDRADKEARPQASAEGCGPGPFGQGPRAVHQSQPDRLKRQ